MVYTTRVVALLGFRESPPTPRIHIFILPLSDSLASKEMATAI